MKIASVVGTRPQFIKLAPLSRELRKRHEELLIDTGQHYDREMVGDFFKEFRIPAPDHSLGVGSGTHGEQTGRIMIKVEKVLMNEDPDLVLVYGDTNSTISGALAAAKLGIPVAHVEAGLRSFDMTMPEEVNRVVTDHVSEALFCPTKTARMNLRREGITKNVHQVGDVMVDSLLDSRSAAQRHSEILDSLSLRKGEYQLLTLHRPSNTDVRENLESILNAIGTSGVMTVFPVHPRTARVLRTHSMKHLLARSYIVTKPLSHMDTVWLVVNASRVLTDSGGLQKEAYLLGTPCITLRDTTEWIETVEAGWNILTGSNASKIGRAIRAFRPSGPRPSVFGSKGAARRIAKVIDRLPEFR